MTPLVFPLESAVGLCLCLFGYMTLGIHTLSLYPHHKADNEMSQQLGWLPLKESPPGNRNFSR